MRAVASKLLELELLKLGMATQAGSDPPSHLTAAQGVLSAFSMLDLVDREEATTWLERFKEEASPSAGSPEVHPLVQAEVRPPVLAKRSTFRGRRGAVKDHRDPASVIDTGPPLAVLAVDAPTAASVRIRGIELYGQFVAVLLSLIDPKVSSAAIVLGMDIQDDCGTVYRRLGTEVPRRGRWEQVFTPGTPADASRLWITIGKERFEIVLPVKHDDVSGAG